MMGSEAPSISQLGAREVGDEIRYLSFGNAVITALIENSLFIDGKRKTSKGLIGKRSVENIRYEMFSRVNRPIKFTVAAGSGTEILTTGVTLESVNGLFIYATLHNPSNNTSCRIEAINTTTKVVKGTSVGATTFSCAAGDELALGASAMPEGSTEAPILNGTDDHNFNVLQTSRWSTSATWIAEAIKQLAGGNRLSREKMYLLWEAFADLERTWILGNYSADVATKNTTTGAQTGYTGEFSTTRGLISLAANAGDAKQAGGLSYLRKSLPIDMGDYVNDNEVYIGLCSNEYYGRVIEEMNAKLAMDQSGEMKQFGIKATEIVTSGPNLKLVKHGAFNIKGLTNKMLVLAPQNLGYVSLKGHDMGPNNGIQTNATHGTQDEVYCTAGIETKDAGKTMTLVSNLF
jgi:hypothetical protein